MHRFILHCLHFRKFSSQASRTSTKYFKLLHTVFGLRSGFPFVETGHADAHVLVRPQFQNVRMIAGRSGEFALRHAAPLSRNKTVGALWQWLKDVLGTATVTSPRNFKGESDKNMLPALHERLLDVEDSHQNVCGKGMAEISPRYEDDNDDQSRCFSITITSNPERAFDGIFVYDAFFDSEFLNNKIERERSHETLRRSSSMCTTNAIAQKAGCVSKSLRPHYSPDVRAFTFERIYMQRASRDAPLGDLKGRNPIRRSASTSQVEVVRDFSLPGCIKPEVVYSRMRTSSEAGAATCSKAKLKDVGQSGRRGPRIRRNAAMKSFKKPNSIQT